jgi:FkbM family methyltransferase
MESVFYFMKGVAREMNIKPQFFEKLHLSVWKKRWLVCPKGKEPYFDFRVARLPDVSNNFELLHPLPWIYADTFAIPMYWNDNHHKSIVEKLDNYLGEGPYGYTDDEIDVTVKQGDVVFDAGAWIGDFSAYAANKGAEVYAFEPVRDTHQWLCKTNEINGNKFHPVNKGLSNQEGEVIISISSTNSGGNSIVRGNTDKGEAIQITTIDKFVESNKIERVDFIKADIEGAERDMLRGATNVLKTFAPKLAICTYHLPDDPEVLEQIIKEANPKYKVVHLRKKLFAAVDRG